MNDYAGGLASFQKAQAIFEAKLGEDHPSVGLCLMAEGEALDRLKQFGAAIETLQRALAIANAKQFPPGQLAQTHFYLGDSLYVTPATRARGRDEVKTALALYDKAHDAGNVTAMKKWLSKH
jgi:tetratricopeptide (TPR) repeat protein